MTDSSTQGIKTVLHPVSDLAKAKTVYAALLGVQPQAEADYYVGFDVAVRRHRADAERRAHTRKHLP